MGTTDHGLSIDEVDRLLDGHLPAGRDDLAGWAADLASLSAAYDRDVDPVDVRRWATQASALAGLAPTDNGDLAATSGSNAYRPASQVAGLPKRRIPVFKSIAAFLATTLGKTMVAGALVAATTTGGLAATGNLPGQSEAPHPASVDDPNDPGVLDAGGLDEDDSSDDSCSTPTSAAPAGAVAAGAGSAGCGDDAVDDSTDDGTDDACDDQAVVGASDPSTGDDDADELDDDSADEPDDAQACEVDDDQADDSSDDAVEADSHDAEEIESDDDSTDTADDATDDVEVDDGSDGSDSGSSGTDDEHQDGSDDDSEGAGTPQG